MELFHMATLESHSTDFQSPPTPVQRLIDEVDAEEMQDETADDVVGKGPGLNVSKDCLANTV
jgi:hypothetical protein